ncbi:FG-GAP repeat protein [Hydrogenophaga sp. BPS33]|uniref:FG-GAP repeat protein n=1 Tax=Hydrogenophaga sp. BPS33 TaxID=2651974 RepID=UPI00131F7681|nr:FG-GAP repeat protein [Hydrogenophaga sp. BPS33]QHE84441.1 integrin [Hydrogenophaga sp. BPS33]
MNLSLFKRRTRHLAGILLLLLASCGGSPVPQAEMEMAIQYIKSSNTKADDKFGTSTVLSADGNTLAVGSPQPISGEGEVHIFVRSGNTWVQQAHLKASDPDIFDNFGASLALSADGHTMAVGAYGEASSSIFNPGDDSLAQAGAAYVFTRNGTTWTQQTYLKASNIGASDGFGWSVALSADGRTLAVGAPWESSNTTGTTSVPNELADYSGAAYVFTRDPADVWTQQAYVKASNTKPDHGFGISVALSGDGHTLAVGASWEASGFGGNEADTSEPGAGAAYTFTRDHLGTWTQQRYLKASNIGAYEEFGWSLALSADGHTLAVGAYRENGPGDSMPEAGAAYVFAFSAGDWHQQALFRGSYPHTLNHFGIRLALTSDGNTLAVGAVHDNSNAIGFNATPTSNTVVESGAVHVLTREGSTWRQQAYVKASNSRERAELGAVTLSGNGLTWAFGAPSESSNAKGINGNQADTSAPEAGAVYLVDLNPPGSDGSCTPQTFPSCRPPAGW